jgi:Zn-finger nucleic acid-binding protein
MRQYERNAVTIDQCNECRGVFLDRGELDKLIDAEARWADTPAPAQPQQQYAQPPPQQYAQPQYPQQGYHQPYREQYYKKNKRKSFLDELFD